MPGDHEAYKPAEIAALIETAWVAKAALPLHRMATLALLAGAFIGFGAAFWRVAMAGAVSGFGPQRVIGGAAFAPGLILVVVGGQSCSPATRCWPWRRWTGGSRWAR